MLSSSLWDREKLTVKESLHRLWNETPIRQELVELLGLLDEQASHLPLTLDADRQECPQAGVRWDEDTQTDLFFVTLEKSERDYSPTTRYRDYAMSPNLFHWESQSTTRADSHTGQRYINHEQMGTRLFIFARERKQDDGRTMPYLFLGPARYVRHRRERPMEIVWRLQYEMPTDFYHEAAVAAE